MKRDLQNSVLYTPPQVCIVYILVDCGGVYLHFHIELFDDNIHLSRKKSLVGNLKIKDGGEMGNFLPLDSLAFLGFLELVKTNKLMNKETLAGLLSDLVR